MKETWLKIKGFEDYEVSDLGRVRSLNYNKTGKVKMLKPGINNCGYYSVGLSNNGKQKKFLIHRLVVETFIGKIPKGLVVNHINEDKSDNRLTNLEIVTIKQNNNHGTRNERAAKAMSKAKSKQLDLLEVAYPYRKYTFPSSCEASLFFGYKAKETVGKCISNAKKNGKNFINLRKNKYFFVQQ